MAPSEVMAMPAGAFATGTGVPATPVATLIGVMSPPWGMAVVSTATQAVEPFGAKAIAAGAPSRAIGVPAVLVPVEIGVTLPELALPT